MFRSKGRREEPGVVGRCSLSPSVEDDETLGSLLIHDPVAAFSASDRVPGSDLVLGVALAADVDHRVPDGPGGVGGRAWLRVHGRRNSTSS